MDKLKTVTITISGPHNTGRTTIGVLFRNFLVENGFSDVKVTDTMPLPTEQKAPFYERFTRNRERPIRIIIVTDPEES